MSKVTSSNRKEASRERILDAAARAVRRGGFGRVGVAGVMHDAGLTHGGFYAHFDSKTALLSAAVVRSGKEAAATLEKNMARLISAGLSPFRALVETYLYGGEISNRENGCPVAALCSEMPAQAPDVVEASRYLVRNLHRIIRQTLPAHLPKAAAWTVASRSSAPSSWHARSATTRRDGPCSPMPGTSCSRATTPGHRRTAALVRVQPCPRI